MLAAPGDPSALAVALNGVLVGNLAGREECRVTWLDAGAERAAAWSMADLAERYGKLYDQAMVVSRS